MPASRCRIIRWTVVAVVAPVLLLASYVSAWLCVSRAVHDGHLTVADTNPIRPIFAPLIRYSESELPGAQLLKRLWWKVNPGTWEASIFDGFGSPAGPLAPSHPESPLSLRDP
jgi:hypothetical protein